MEFYRRWWRGEVEESWCRQCRQDAAILRPLEDFYNRDFFKDCFLYEFREEIDKMGRVPTHKEAATQTTTSDFFGGDVRVPVAGGGKKHRLVS